VCYGNAAAAAEEAAPLRKQDRMYPAAARFGGFYEQKSQLTAHRSQSKGARMHEPYWGKPSAIGDSREHNYAHSPYVSPLSCLPQGNRRQFNVPVQICRRAHLHHYMYPLAVRQWLQLRVL
jgi:hypothetical protein